MELLLKGLGYLYYLQPRKIQLFWGSCLGSLLCVLGFRSSVARQNLGLAYPNQPEMQRKVFRESYRHLGSLILEIFLVFGPLRRFVLKYVEVRGIENWHAAHALGRGVVFLSSHMGNWEVMAATGGVIPKIDLMLVTKRLKPKWLHRAIEAGRLKCGVTATYEPRTLKDILSHLKKNGTVGFVLDQYSGAPVGVRVPLFGVPVGTSLAVATVVKRMNTPILPVENYRTEDGRWVVEVLPAIPWKEFDDAHYELAANTAEFASSLEKGILAHPAQWLWVHRRFKGDLSPLRPEEWKTPRLRK